MRFERQIMGFAIALALASCADRAAGGGDRIVARSSVVASVIPPRASGASVEERFGLPSREPKADGGAAEAAGLLRWDLPAGWVERAPSAMRVANFLAAGDADAECYLSILAGDAGGIGANVNRWLGQMGQPALGPAQIEALPRAPMFQRDAVLLEADGAFTGMSGSDAKSDHRLLGLLLVDPAGSAFLKLVGPSALVARERASFLALAASFRSSQEAPKSSAPPEPRTERAAGLVAHVPGDWMRVTPKPPRALDLRIDADVECSITVLAGAAGGARANIDRWRAQLGLGPLDDAQYLGLETVPMLGAAAYLVEASAGEKGVLGVVSSADDRSVFVKLTGPVGQIPRHRAAFLDLCRTLEDD